MAYTSHANKDNTNNNIDLLDTSGNHSTLNVSKNIAQLELEQVEFEIPFDIHAETDALDWVPAAELLDTTTINNNNDNSFAAVDDRPQQNEEEEEQWDVFEPFDEQQEEEGRATDESTVSDMEVARAAPKESMQSEPSVRTGVVFLVHLVCFCDGIDIFLFHVFAHCSLLVQHVNSLWLFFFSSCARRNSPKTRRVTI